MRPPLALVLALATTHAVAQSPTDADALAPAPARPAVAFEQRLDAPVPLAATFTDSAGRVVRLSDELPRDVPTLLMLGYHRCPQLCGLATQGVLEAMNQSGLPPAAARLLFVSIDPGETAQDAADRLRADRGYERLLAGVSANATMPIERLVGPPASIGALARSVGFVYQPGDATNRFAHPAGVVVLTPDGRVSRYLMGVRFDAGELRDAIATAGNHRIGTLTDRLALLCAHLDPHLGAHSEAVMALARVAGLGTLALLALFAWRHREGR